MDEPNQDEGPQACIDGAPATLGDAAQRAAALLAGARRPLVAGLGGASTEAQRAAVGIADILRGVADWTTVAADRAAMLAFQTVGASAASWGEAAERTDLVVGWRCTPHPALNSATAYKVVVGSGGSPDDAGVDEVICLADGVDYEAIAVLRAIVAEIDLDPDRVLTITGVELAVWQALAVRLASAQYAVVVRSPELAGQGAPPIAAMTSLAQELHQSARVVTITNPAAGNRPGAENVLAWQTGFPLGVDFTRGYPRYGPGEYTTADLLERNEVDAALIVCQDEMSSLPPSAATNLRGLPRVVLTSQDDSLRGAEVEFRVASLHEGGGTYYRSDGLALPLDEVATSTIATAEDVLNQIRSCLVAP